MILYLILATKLGQTAAVRACLCRKHWLRRRIGLVVAWSALAGVAILFCIFVEAPAAGFLLALKIGALPIIAAAAFGIAASRVLSPRAIDADTAWLKGAAPEFLAELPEAQACDSIY